MNFLPDDFIDMDWENDLPVRQSASRIANAKLKDWLNAAPKVYGTANETDPFGSLWGIQPAQSDKNTARLVCVEEIKK